MKAPIKLNNNHVDAEKVSFIGPIDTHIHHTKNPACSYFFIIVVDGRNVEIESYVREEIRVMRDSLIQICHPEYSEV